MMEVWIIYLNIRIWQIPSLAGVFIDSICLKRWPSLQNLKICNDYINLYSQNHCKENLFFWKRVEYIINTVNLIANKVIWRKYEYMLGFLYLHLFAVLINSPLSIFYYCCNAQWSLLKMKQHYCPNYCSKEANSITAKRHAKKKKKCWVSFSSMLYCFWKVGKLSLAD